LTNAHRALASSVQVVASHGVLPRTPALPGVNARNSRGLGGCRGRVRAVESAMPFFNSSLCIRLREEGRDATVFSREALLQLLERLEVDVVRLTRVDADTAAIAVAAIGASSGREFRPTIEGPPEIVFEAWKSARGLGALPSVVRLVVREEAELPVVEMVVSELTRATQIVEIAVASKTPALADACRRLNVWRVIDDSSEDDVFAATVFIDAAGHLVSATGARSRCPVVETGLNEALAEIGCDRGCLAQGSKRLPWAFEWPTRKGPPRVIYWSGGSMALGTMTEVQTALAGLGFEGVAEAEVEQWLRAVADTDAIVKCIPMFGTSPPRSARAVARAAWIAMGAIERVAEDLAGVRAQEQCARLAEALVVLAMSALEFEMRLRAVGVLKRIGTLEAERAADDLAKSVPELGTPIARWFDNRAGCKAKDQGKSASVARDRYEIALKDLRAIFPALTP